MKTIFENAIRKGGFDLSTMLKRIDEYHIEGKLTDAERDSLIEQTRGNASPNVDPESEVQKLWTEVRKLIKRVENLEGCNTEGDVEVGTVAEYVQPTGAHDAYFAGDLVTYNGVIYECIAPDGVACVWSPDVMPTYWKAE